MSQGYGPKDKLPHCNRETGEVWHPNVVILGAGASLAAFPQGDAHGRQIPLMRNLTEVVGLTDLLAAAGYTKPIEDFEAFYDSIATDETKKELTQAVERHVWEYFSKLKLPDEPTLYDYLITSLRNKDLIASFNWDPFLLQAYCRNAVLGIENLPRIVFLHGNVGVGVCHTDKTMGRLGNNCTKCYQPLTPSKLLYPVKRKDYNSDPFIENGWNILQKALERSCLVTVFGYSAPVTDVEARELMLNVWQDNPVFNYADFEMIDVKEADELLENWKDFTFSHHWRAVKKLNNSFLLHFPRRSCEAFYEQTFMVQFLDYKDFPEFESLEELHDWVALLIEQEENMGKDGIKLSLDVHSN